MPEEEYVKIKKSSIVHALNGLFLGEQEVVDKKNRVMSQEKFNEDDRNRIRHYDKLLKFYENTKNELREVL